MQQTGHANDLVKAKSHAREKPLLAEYRISCPQELGLRIIVHQTFGL